MNEPERWSTRPPSTDRPDDDEARAGLLLRRAVVTQPLDAGALAEIRARLPDGTHAPRRQLALSVAVGLALFLSGGAVVMSATLLGHWSPFRRAPDVAPAPAPPPPRHPRPLAMPVGSVAEPTVAPAPTVLATVARAVRRTEVPRVLEAPAPELAPTPADEPARPSTIAREAALVGAALRKLRDDGDAAGALTLLDAHDAEFAATGALAEEARTTRVEALLRLGQHGRALALLDVRSPTPVGRGRELLATRGELRADVGRCREAIADFEMLLADDAAADDAAERALYGHAACRARTGDADASRADLRTYLARFPDGRFASRVRGALNR